MEEIILIKESVATTPLEKDSEKDFDKEYPFDEDYEILIELQHESKRRSDGLGRY